MNFSSFISALFISVCYIGSVQCGNILILHTVFRTSHLLTLKSLALTLISRGHSVHVVKWKDDNADPYEGRHLPTNLSVTTLFMNNSDGKYFALSKEERATFKTPAELMWKTGLSPSVLLFAPEWRLMFPFLAAHCETLWSNSKFGEKLKAAKYDLAIVDFMWNECSIAYARHYLGVQKIVGFWGMSWEGLQTDTTSPLASSQFIGSGTVDRLANVDIFWIEKLARRVFQTFKVLLTQIVMQIYFYFIDGVIRGFAQHTDHSLKLQHSLDGMLINCHETLEIFEKPRPPHYISIGGIQLLDEDELNETEIPIEILRWIESAETSTVIFFSFGSTLNSESGPKHIFRHFLEAFGEFPEYKVLFQYHGDCSNMSIPENVMVVGWVSQQKILAHPKTKLFVSHCGLHGLIEAVYHGVPLLCMPIVTDGLDNLNKVIHLRIGLGLNMGSLTTKTIVNGVKEILLRKSFKTNVDRISSLMRHARDTPKDKAVSFIENLLECNGKSRYIGELSLVEYFCLDIGIFIFILSYLTFKICRMVYRKLVLKL